MVSGDQVLEAGVSESVGLPASAAEPAAVSELGVVEGSEGGGGGGVGALVVLEPGPSPFSAELLAAGCPPDRVASVRAVAKSRAMGPPPLGPPSVVSDSKPSAKMPASNPAAPGPLGVQPTQEQMMQASARMQVWEQQQQLQFQQQQMLAQQQSRMAGSSRVQMAAPQMWWQVQQQQRQMQQQAMPSAPAVPSRSPCWYHFNGGCRWGAACNYAHS